MELINIIAGKVEAAELTAHCQIDKWNCQIIVSFDKRPDVEIALLTPYLQEQVKKGKIDVDSLTEMLFLVRKMANRSIN